MAYKNVTAFYNGCQEKTSLLLYTGVDALFN